VRWVEQQFQGEHLAINPYPAVCGQAESCNKLKASIPAPLSLIFEDISHCRCQEANPMSTFKWICFWQMLSYRTYKRVHVFDSSAGR